MAIQARRKRRHSHIVPKIRRGRGVEPPIAGRLRVVSLKGEQASPRLELETGGVGFLDQIAPGLPAGFDERQTVEASDPRRAEAISSI
jgi:hypothetical protein